MLKVMINTVTLCLCHYVDFLNNQSYLFYLLTRLYTQYLYFSEDITGFMEFSYGV